MIILLFFTFVSGLVTILAPCIWPLLPIIFSASATGGKKKPLGVTLGILVSFGSLTLSISYLVHAFSFDSEILRSVAVMVIGIMGIALFIPKFGAILETFMSRISGRLGNLGRVGDHKNDGFGGGFLVGLALGIIWTPCAGPILATIITLAAIRSISTEIVLMMLFYIIGVGIPLFIFALFSQRLFQTNKTLSKYTGRIQQIFGIAMILMALAIWTGYDRTLQADLLDAVPSYSSFLNNLEGNSDIENQLDRLKNGGLQEVIVYKQGKAIDPMGNVSGKYLKAPEFTGIIQWLNVESPLTMAGLQGKVVLVDFWTYTCINCIRTLPHIKSWYDTYKNDGLVVVGVHTPEFDFEKKQENVEKAIADYSITYPVALDNDYKTWRAYDNHYWPAKYLIDINGNIRYTHFGEGKYDQTEDMIRQLLMELNDSISNSAPEISDQSPTKRVTAQTPEVYLGLARMQYYIGKVSPKTGINEFPFETTVSESNRFTFGGTWSIDQEYAETVSNSTLSIRFTGEKVFLVITPKQTGDQIRVLLDNNPVTKDQSGADVTDGVIKLDEPRLYEIIDLQGSRGEHMLKLEFLSPGIQVFAFTFG